jgi:hypothetical protein
MPVCFLHLNIEMAGSYLEIGKRQISFGIRDVADLIEPRHRFAHMRRIGHRLFARAGKGEGRGRQRIFIGRRKTAMRCRAIRFPSGFGHGLIFHYGVFRERYDLDGCSGIFLSMYCINRRWVAPRDWVATSAIRFMI